MVRATILLYCCAYHTYSKWPDIETTGRLEKMRKECHNDWESMESFFFFISLLCSVSIAHRREHGVWPTVEILASCLESSCGGRLLCFALTEGRGWGGRKYHDEDEKMNLEAGKENA